MITYHFLYTAIIGYLLFTSHPLEIAIKLAYAIASKMEKSQSEESLTELLTKKLKNLKSSIEGESLTKEEINFALDV